MTTSPGFRSLENQRRMRWKYHEERGRINERVATLSYLLDVIPTISNPAPLAYQATPRPRHDPEQNDVQHKFVPPEPEFPRHSCFARVTKKNVPSRLSETAFVWEEAEQGASTCTAGSIGGVLSLRARMDRL